MKRDHLNTPLPDVAAGGYGGNQLPLDWVGMQGIALPLQLIEEGAAGSTVQQVHAWADVQVDLPDPKVKGIHMSRLYLLLDEFAAKQSLGAAALHDLLLRMVDSHADCSATRARLALVFPLLRRQPALLTAGLAGWKSYPVRLQAQLSPRGFSLEVNVEVGYSSTCPCSAALARQLLADGFAAQFGTGSIDGAAAQAWLREHGSLATPHSQRSVAAVTVALQGDGPLGLFGLIDAVEAALATPLQTAVKRADEQGFARLNGQNLMYVEDAARRVQAALAPRYAGVQVQVRHLESLHPHDAVAQAGALIA
ncbi:MULTISPECIES: GTP cyclohydrolase FolE2 [unclassified Janthinobacterium]|uniref:GTP cyclohydrolase FolE2 n=1 Tax=unclassified Janthinobacterium TaxID=2610881 RepID=UPI0016191C25|nr:MULTISPECIES: GTP cyclohydrolase FolE2 [unclassified Janthinobacterium]MBB5368467.1 GTP cyclohydrolase I [Janthinobacterium sp. K2C7]MBB5381997.1 GTP cyclohydrolase I [Janthinobacterium sp. K2Li3]MBB5386849.1 GTP cyclohydrolase I [Janthinobacterium sp. K2E3]